MGSRRVVVVSVGVENALQVCFAEDDHMVKTFSPDRADDAFHITVLPW